MSYFGLGRPGLLPDDTTTWAGVATQVPVGTPNATGAIEIPTDPAMAQPDYTKYILIGAAVLVALVLVRR